MRIALALLAALLLAAPVQGAEETAIAETVGRTVADYLVPAYGALTEETERLEGALADYCAASSPEGRNAVVDAFAATLRAWAGVDFLRFGPMAEDGRLERFAFWPDVHNTGARQMRRFLAGEDPALLAAGALARQSAAVQGLPALESLLWSGDEALTATLQPAPYRCALAHAVAENLGDIAAAASSAWTDGPWAGWLTEPGPGNPLYRTEREALTEVLKAVLTGLEQLRDHRLLPSVGATPEEAKASRAPYSRSGQSLPYLAASAEALERYVEASGLLALVPPDRKWIANSIRFEFANLKKALAEAGADLQAALAEPELRQKLVYAAIVLQSLRDLFQGALSAELGVTGGFNALDGD
jgi:predicted lipoprotein